MTMSESFVDYIIKLLCSGATWWHVYVLVFIGSGL